MAKKKEPVCMSVDVGNGHVKLTTWQGGRGTKVADTVPVFSFPSFTTPVRGDDSLNGIGGLSKLEVVVVDVDGIKFRVGPDAIAAAAGRSTRNPTDTFYLSQEYLALFRGALSYMDLPEDCDQIDILGFGLPLTVYKNESIRESVLQRLKGSHSITCPKTGRTRQVRIDKVCLIPQLVSALVAINMQRGTLESIGERTSLIIDAGFGTVLWLTAEGLKPQISRCGGSRGGVSALLSAFADAIDPAFARDPLVMERIDRALCKGSPTVTISGKDYSIADYMPAVQDQIARNLREMEDSVGMIGSIDEINLIGGGASLYLPVIQRIWSGRDVSIPAENAQFLNLIGYQVQAEHAGSKA